MCVWWMYLLIGACEADLGVVLEGPHLVLAHLVAVHPGAVGALVPGNKTHVECRVSSVQD